PAPDGASVRVTRQSIDSSVPAWDVFIFLFPLGLVFLSVRRLFLYNAAFIAASPAFPPRGDS
ncbi:hypothetical protein, partial [Cloacibacillus porcorum]|uniref:hypothetical protein n=1 Tax=Cloacibacillus porcorum TaxID=1197717 RepID=UPI0019826C6E